MLNLTPASPLDEPTPKPRRWRTTDIAQAVIVALAIWFGLQLFWKVSALFFLVFLATLFGLAAGRGVDYLERYKIRRGIGATIIVFGTLGLIVGGLALSAPTLISQGKQLQSEFPAAVNKVQEWVDSRPRTGATGALIEAATKSSAAPIAADTNGAGANRQVTPPAPVVPPSEILKQKLSEGIAGASRYLFSFVSSTLAVLGAFVLLLFLAIYIAAEPDVYRGWMLATVPARMRPHVRRVLGEMATVLRKWLVTQLIAMVVIGSISTIVLLVLGVKAPFALGFIAGLLEFIPTVGPVLSAVPALLMAFVDSPEKAFAVLVAYWGIQFLENNLLIPYLMRDGMDLPPAITLVAQMLMTLVFGFVGLMVAVPLTAAVLVPIRIMAERENEREREMARSMGQSGERRAGDRRTLPLAMRITTEHAVHQADRGPEQVEEEEVVEVDVFITASNPPEPLPSAKDAPSSDPTPS